MKGIITWSIFYRWYFNRTLSLYPIKNCHNYDMFLPLRNEKGSNPGRGGMNRFDNWQQKPAKQWKQQLNNWQKPAKAMKTSPGHIVSYPYSNLATWFQHLSGNGCKASASSSLHPNNAIQLILYINQCIQYDQIQSKPVHYTLHLHNKTTLSISLLYLVKTHQQEKLLCYWFFDKCNGR